MTVDPLRDPQVIRVYTAETANEGSCTMRGHITADGRTDHQSVVVIDANGWLMRLCKPHAKALLQELRRVL